MRLRGCGFLSGLAFIRIPWVFALFVAFWQFSCSYTLEASGFSILI